MNSFEPHRPDKHVVVKITTKEADLIQKLRRYQFGKFLVHKIGGNLIRVEITDSQIITDDNEINLG
jgi:hypothetical protein